MTNNESLVTDNCPCCGGESELTIGLVYAMVKCKKCGLNIFSEKNKMFNLVKKWNSRVKR